MATTTALVRSCTSSLANRRGRCVFTVASAITRCRRISALVRPFRHGVQDVGLTVGQRLLNGPPQPRDQLLGDPGSKHRLAPRRRVDGVDESLAGGVLERIAEGTGLHPALDLRVGVVRRQDQHPGPVDTGRRSRPAGQVPGRGLGRVPVEGSRPGGAQHLSGGSALQTPSTAIASARPPGLADSPTR